MDSKQEVIKKLKQDFCVTRTFRFDNEDVYIECDFIFKGRKGKFRYTLEGNKRGIDEVMDFDEEEGEDIYAEIHDWADNHLRWETKILVDGEEIEKMI